MNDILFVLCWTPILLLTVLAVFFKRSALELSIYGFVFVAALVLFFFKTAAPAIFLAGLDGVLTTLPLIIVVFAGIVLSQLLSATGSLRRIVDWLMGGVRNSFHRTMLISFGVGNFMEGAAVIAEPVVAPMLHAAGVAPMAAAALSVIGYSGLMTLELAGVIITVLSLVTGLPVRELGIAAAWLSIPAAVLMAGCVPVFLKEASESRKRLAFTLVCGLCLGLGTLGAALAVGIPVSGMLGGALLIGLLILIGNRRLDVNTSIFRDVLPFLFIIGVLVAVNSVPLLKELTYTRLVFTVAVMPEHVITYRPFFSAYLYLFCAIGLACFVHGVPPAKSREIVRASWSKAWRASVAMALFGAMGQVIAFSGYDLGTGSVVKAVNIPWVISHGLQTYTGALYPLFVPLLGWVGTFLTGYGVASLMLFGQLQVHTAAIMGISPVWLSAGLAVGASIGSISSPFKIALATPMCNAMGLEGAILRWTIPLGIVASLIIGGILYMIV